MWQQLILVIVFIILSYVYRKVTSSEGSTLKFNFNFFVFYFASTCLALVIWPLFLFKPKDVGNAKLAANILKHVSKYYEIKWHLRNEDVIKEDRGAIIVSNHQSAFDILGMFTIWDKIGKLAPIAKKELFYVWPFGLAAYLAGVVFIDRSNTRKSYEALDITREIVTKNKTKVWLFPEGTRNKFGSELLPFKKGAFSMAIAAQVPIIPLVFSPYYFIDRKKKHFGQMGHVIIECLEPVSTVGLTKNDIPQLTEKVRDMMVAAYEKLSREVRTSSEFKENSDSIVLNR